MNRSKIQEEVDCIICKESRFTHFLDVECRYSNESFSLVQCSCSLILTSPRPREDKIGAYYKNINYQPHSAINSKTSLFQNLSRKFSYFWKTRLLKKYISNKTQRAIDIGGGDGSLAMYLNNKNVHTDVYEKDSSCVAGMIEKNIFASDNLLDFESKGYHLVMLWHSLEHVHGINELFNNMNRITRKDSIAIIATPNASASEIIFFKDKWVAWDAPRHLYHFNYAALSALLDKHGWEVVDRRKMFQDTFFNIFGSINSNSFFKIFIFAFIASYSFVVQLFFNDKSSSNLLICRKK